MRKIPALVGAMLAGIVGAVSGGPAAAGPVVVANPAPVDFPRIPGVPVTAARAVRGFDLEDLIGSGAGDVFRRAPVWPHNRPRPGWRAVQSRARHAEISRRQRRNA